MASKRSRQAFEADLQKQESPYVSYGTPLPPLDDHARDDGSYVPIWKQEVTDDRGRKRLHGAFTGGFSAGYFNTVGSKEGWTPSTFVSSRQNRNKDGKATNQQRPEDFMDDEDLREAEEARNLSTSDDFAGFGTTERDSMRAAGLMDIFRPTGSTIGVQLLKKMGWKEGQGIGPKVKRKANIDDGETGSGQTHLFAPENSAMISFSQKTGQKGLGYVGEAHLDGSASSNPAEKTRQEPSDDEEQIGTNFSLAGPKKKSTKKATGRGFGVGILNDTGSDDEDPYEMGPKISYSKVIGGDKKIKKKKDVAQSNANPLVKTKPVFLSQKLLSAKSTAGFRRSHDGRLPLEGFILADELDNFGSISISNQDDEMKPPEIPRDWKSSKIPAAPEQQANTFKSTASAAKSSTHTSTTRAALLGESPLPGKSVFDFLTPAARAKLATASGKPNLPPAGSEAAPPGYESIPQTQTEIQSHLLDLIPKLDPTTALQALSRTWLPYGEDEAKRSRYRIYLELRAGLTTPADSLPDRAPDTTTEDWATELEEFARAAQVFKPVTGLMASRFTSASSSSGQPGEDDGKGLQARAEDPAVEAAKMGMFGPLTRSVVNFYPTRLLCKRFNVRVLDILEPGNSAQQGSSSQYQHQHQPPSNSTAATLTQPQPQISTSASTPQLSITETPHHYNEAQASVAAAPVEAIIDPEKNEALEKERPGAAVFKAIFGSEDEDEGEDI